VWQKDGEAGPLRLPHRILPRTPFDPMARITIIPESEATGYLAGLYETIADRRGGVSNVLKIQSLLPETLNDHFKLYRTLMFETKSTGLPRELLEMVAVIVSATNGCSYCVSHHSKPLHRLVKDSRLVGALQKRDWESLSRLVDEKTLVALALAEKSTERPTEVVAGDVDRLKRLGYSDIQILHLVLVISYFNFVNRNVMVLGVELESDYTSMCK